MLRCVRHTALASFVVYAFIAAGPASARTCFPVSAEVVSLGEKNARAYAGRSLKRAVESRRASLESSGRKVAKVTRDGLACAPYPNLLGADEWQCSGRARVCAGD